MRTKAADGQAALEHQKREQMMSFFQRFKEAFDELHTAVVAFVRTPGAYIPPHANYPIFSISDSGFPIFHEARFFQESTPRDYVGSLQPRGLLGLMIAGPDRAKHKLDKMDALTDFLTNSIFAGRLKTEGRPSWIVDRMVGDAVEFYLHRYGLDSPINPEFRDRLIWPMIFGTIFRRLNVRLVVPIALTNFEAGQFKLTDSTFIFRLPRRMQLGRFRVQGNGSGVPSTVAGAATHAFVSTGWYVEPDDIFEARNSLSHISENVLEAVDSFFGALRVVTGISTGYAQVLWAPKGWSLNYFCDLPTLYGTTLRRYPNDFDDFGWAYTRPSVSREQLGEVRRVYSELAGSQSEALTIAVRRLNSCLTRTDSADALLDAIIGLEVLLGDGENQSLSYKLRLRAAALAFLKTDPTKNPADVARMTKSVYDARSAIVHGLRKKGSKKATQEHEPRFEQERLIASDLLRFVIDVLLRHPRYLSAKKIDEELLLRSTDLIGND